MNPVADIPRRFKRTLATPPETHLFAVGQAVRLKGGLLSSGDIYLVTAFLPPRGASLQYRIRNEAEKFERMALQADLEPVRAPTIGKTDALIEKSFASGPAI